MAGGQGGLSFLGEDKVFTVGATAAVILLGQAFLGCIKMPGFGDDNSAYTDLEQDCKDAWAVENDGNEDTQIETAILEQSWCIDVIEAMKAEKARERVEAMTEGTRP